MMVDKYTHHVPARRSGKSLMTLNSIKWCLATNKSLAIGTSDVDALHDKIKLEFPDADISKKKGFVVINERLKNG